MTTNQNECECRIAERPPLLPPSASPAFPRAAAVLSLHAPAGRGGLGQRIRGFWCSAFQGAHARAGIARAAGEGILRCYRDHVGQSGWRQLGLKCAIAERPPARMKRRTACRPDGHGRSGAARNMRMFGARTSRGSPLLAGIAALSLLAAAGPAVTNQEGSLAGGAVDVAAGGASPADGGPYFDWPRHGPWRIAYPDGSVEEGCYVRGFLHGEWVLRDSAGRIVARERWCLGRSTGSGLAEWEDAPCGVALPDACRRRSAP